MSVPSLSACRTKTETRTCEVKQLAWWVMAGDLSCSSWDLKWWTPLGGCRLLLLLTRGHSPEEDGCSTREKEYGSYFQDTWITRSSSQWQWTTIRIKGIWGLPRVPGDKPQEGRNLLATEQQRSGTWQWNNSDSENCLPWRERLEKSISELSLPVKSYPTYCKLQTNYSHTASRSAHNVEVAFYWLLQYLKRN